MNRRPTRAGRRVLRYMAEHGGKVSCEANELFGLTPSQFRYLLKGLLSRGLVAYNAYRVVMLTDLGDDELTGAAARRRRVVFGERNGNSKLTVDDVAAIRRDYAGGALQRDLAATYGVGQNHISNVVRRLTWKDVA